MIIANRLTVRNHTISSYTFGSIVTDNESKPTTENVVQKYEPDKVYKCNQICKCSFCKKLPKESVKQISEESENILKTFSGLGVRFVDEDFPASRISLFCCEELRRENKQSDPQFEKSVKTITKWQRPENIRTPGDTSDWTLINDPSPSDICQGGLGNCWFVAALTLLADRKELLSKILVTTKINPAGAYTLKLFKDGNWIDVIVDDFLPCDSFQRLVFSSCRKRQLWVPLIEKAMSKLHGSYESLQSGSLWDGLNYLTGFVSERIVLKSETDVDFLWGRLLSFHSCGFLMGATVRSIKKAEEDYTKKGLVTNHVYSILKVISWENDTRLIQLKNPWGRFSWNGDWSDTSPLWSETMRQKFAPNQSHKGIFWMNLKDFIEYFTSVDVCKIRTRWKNYTLNGILPPYCDPDCQPCFEVICKSQTCEIDVSLYQSTRRNSKEIINLTDMGMLIFEMGQDSPKYVELVKPVDKAQSARERCVTTSLMLTQGHYCLLPFSFSNWNTDEKDETFYTFTLSIHSSQALKCSTIAPSRCPNILADALICYSKTYGKRKRIYKYTDISIFSGNLGVGYYAVVENKSEKEITIEIDFSKSTNYNSTRGDLVTCDIIKPNYSQVLQLLTAKKNPRKSSQICNTYRLIHQSEDRVSTSGKQTYKPQLDGRILGLHSSRPIIN